MRWTQTLIPTQKDNPADAVIVSHQLMIRAGLIRQVTAGAYDFLPLGWRSLRKAAQIVREEMDAIGCAEVFLPTLQPLELWQKTGRDVSYGDNLFKFKDRHGRFNVLGPTHEEVVTELVAAYISSYKQLPLSLYQIQTKFRDEFRPRFGLLRVREFLMKDAYSFHADLESLNRVYDDFYRAYEAIFTRCGVPYVVVEAESGPIGGSASHEFMAACAAGEDTIVTSDKGNYAANVEKAEIGERPSTFGGDVKGALEQVHTPNLPGIEEVGKVMKVKPKNMLKSMVYVLTKASDDPDPTRANEPSYLLAIVRGDHDVNEPKLTKAAARFVGEPVRVAMAPEALAREDGFAIGFVGPHAILGRNDTFMLVDPDAAQGGFWASGANEVDHHVKYFNWAREVGDVLADPTKVAIADIRNAAAGDPSPRNDGGKLVASKGIEIGHVFKLGTKYSDALGANYLDDKGAQHPLIMGCYGIGVGRILIAAVESLHDDKGIIWPPAIAPFSVIVTPIKYDGEVKAAADKLYDQLNAAGIDTLLDDRPDARPGVKFADADLIGIPVRITVGDRGLKEGKVELNRRRASEPEMVAVDGVVAAVADALKQS
jgi:prolyl-tRNA synthetase